MPLALIDRASSSSAPSRNRVRGWYGVGSMRSISPCCGPADIVSRAGAAAAAPTACWGAGGGTCGSGSRMSAPSPRPNAFLGIGDYLLSQLCVPFGSLAMHIIENNRLTETWSFRKANVARNNALKDLRTEETAQIRGDLTRKARPFVVHRKQNALDLQAGVQCSADSHECIKKLRYALERQIFALNWHQHGVCGHKGIQSQQVQCRRAVQDDKAGFIAEAIQKRLQFVFASLGRNQFNRGTG